MNSIWLPRTIVLLLAMGSLAPLAIWGAALRWQSQPALQDEQAD